MNPWRNIADLSKNEIQSLQNKKLNHFINSNVYPFSPHYQKIFDDRKIDPRKIKTADDLRYLPFTSKLDFISQDNPEKFKEFVLQPDIPKIRKHWNLSRKIPLATMALFMGKEAVQDKFTQDYRPVFMTFTTGTTSKPIPFLYSNYDIKNLHASGARMLTLFDINITESIVNMFPYAPHLAFWQVVFGGFSSCALILSTGGGKVMGTEGNLAAVQRMRPSTILGVPSFVYHTLRTAQEKGLKMEYIKRVVLGASRVTIPFKKKLAEILEAMGARNVSIFGTYGFTESRCAWAECPTSLDVSSGYHLYPDKEIFEIVDPKTGEPKREGEDGELVYTTIDARASVVLRYRTGDFVKGGITYEPCPYCKRQVPRISSDITRLSDIKDLQLSKIKGSLVNLSNFGAALADIPVVDEWQVELRKKNNDPFDSDEVVVYVSCKEPFDQLAVKDLIKDKILATTEIAPNAIQFIGMADMVRRLELETANKEKRIIDSRPKD